MVATFLLVTIGWVFFRSENIINAFEYLLGMFSDFNGDELFIYIQGIPYVLTLIILFLATSWTDIITFYRDKLFTKDNKILGKMEALKVLLTEVIVIILLISPLIFIYDKKTGLILSYFIAIALLFINNYINMNYDIQNNITTILSYLFVSYIIYLISDFLIKIIK